MITRAIGLMVLLVLPFFICAQDKAVRYYDKKGHATDSARSYYWETTIGRASNAYYTRTGKMYSATAPETDSTEIVQYYHENGRLKTEGNFFRGSPRGIVNSFYQNGQRQAELILAESEDNQPGPSIGIINYWDSIGNQLVTEGNGLCHCDLYPFDDISNVEIGKVMDGQKVGHWRGSEQDGLFTFEEIYESGVLMKGTSRCGGETFEYKTVDFKANPPGGMKTFYDAIARGIRYPRNALSKGIEGKIFVQFTVEKDGNLTNVKPIKSLDPECDQEAVRIVREATTWNPAQHRGQVLQTTYTQVIIFQID